MSFIARTLCFGSQQCFRRLVRTARRRRRTLATPSSGSTAAARYGKVSEAAVMAPDNTVIETLGGGPWPWKTTPRRTRPWDMAADEVGPEFLLNASVCRLV